jgi:PERQ amino acid-rich with GYF domain-containing protein
LVEDTLPKFTENPKMLKTEAHDVRCLESSVNLPDDSSSLFDTPFISEKPEYLGKNSSPPPGEVSLYYQDPQGGIQGPFLDIDIISWFQEGYFGLDLRVCPTDAPEGTPYRPLGEVMPQLKQKFQVMDVPVSVPVISNSEAEVAKQLGGSLQYNNNKNMLDTDGSEVPLEVETVRWAPQSNRVDPLTASRFEEQWLQDTSTGMDNEGLSQTKLIVAFSKIG